MQKYEAFALSGPFWFAFWLSPVTNWWDWLYFTTFGRVRIPSTDALHGRLRCACVFSVYLLSTFMIMVFILSHTVIVAQKRDREIDTFDGPLHFCEKDVCSTLKKKTHFIQVLRPIIPVNGVLCAGCIGIGEKKQKGRFSKMRCDVNEYSGSSCRREKKYLNRRFAKNGDISCTLLRSCEFEN